MVIDGRDIDWLASECTLAMIILYSLSLKRGRLSFSYVAFMFEPIFSCSFTMCSYAPSCPRLPPCFLASPISDRAPSFRSGHPDHISTTLITLPGDVTRIYIAPRKEPPASCPILRQPRPGGLSQPSIYFRATNLPPS